MEQFEKGAQSANTCYLEYIYKYDDNIIRNIR